MARINGLSALLILIPSWLGLLGAAHWLLDLAAHFRWQYLIASALVIVWAVWQRRRHIVALAVLTFLLNAFLIGRLAWHADAGNEVADDFTLNVLSLNVLTSNANTQAVIEHLMTSDADVVFLMEVDQKWATALEALRAKYPHRVVQPRNDNFGLALLSRIPWTDESILGFGGAGVPSVQVRLTYQGRQLVLIGTHPVPPLGSRYAFWRNQQLELLTEHVSRLNDPVLVVGDLNSTPWSAGMRIATAGRLDYRSIAAPWTPTWRARSVFAIPIDHALVTAPLKITRREVGPDVGSDHRSLRISIGWER